MKTILILAALAAAAPVAAQMNMPPNMPMPAAAPACTAAVTVPGFEGWGKTPAQPQLTIGAFSDLALAPAEAVKFSPPLNRPAKPGDTGGIYALAIDKPGIYRFALGAGAWIDVIESKGARMESVAHMHGPACSGITKIVDYRLDPAQYVVQFSATTGPRLKVMLIGPK